MKKYNEYGQETLTNILEKQARQEQGDNEDGQKD